jgi:hypothetical protein
VDRRDGDAFRGWHLYFRHPGGRISNSASLLAPGVDIRGDGGLALLPPSRRGDHEYRWQIDDPSALATLATMPPWLVAACRPRESPTTAPIAAGGTAMSSAAHAARFAGILGILNRAPEPSGDRGGGRNNALFWCALRLRDLIAEGAPPTLAGDLYEAAVRRGLPAAEARATIASGLRQPRR